MSAATGWATRQIAEFLAVLAGAGDRQAAVEDALLCFSVSFEADACAFLHVERVTSSIGWLDSTYDEELSAVARNERTGINRPGIGWCETVAITVDREEQTMVLLARARGNFTPREIGLLRSMAAVL